MKITFKKITNTNDLESLISVYNTVFETDNNSNIEYLKSIISNNSIYNLGAYVDNKIIRGLTAYELALLSTNKEFYIYDIGVLSEYRKMKVGTNLINELKIEAKKRNISTIFVEAESDDEVAVDFYRSLKEEEIGVQHFNFKV